MTLIYEPDLIIQKMYLELSRSRHLKVGTLETDRQTDATECTTEWQKLSHRTRPANEDSCIAKQF